MSSEDRTTYTTTADGTDPGGEGWYQVTSSASRSADQVEDGTETTTGGRGPMTETQSPSFDDFAWSVAGLCGACLLFGMSVGLHLSRAAPAVLLATLTLGVLATAYACYRVVRPRRRGDEADPGI